MRDHDPGLAGVHLDDRAHWIDPDALDELLDQRTVEQGIAPPVEQAERVRGRERLAVRTGVRQRIEAVNESRNDAEQPDLLPLQAPRIAAAIVALVVQGRQRRKLGREAGTFLQDRGRVPDVRFAGLELGVGQGLRLVQQIGGQPHFSHVLQQSDHAEKIQLIARQLQEAAERDHVDGDADRAIEGVLAFLLQLGEQEHRVGIAHDAVRHVGHRFLHPGRVDRLARLDGVEHMLEDRLGLLLGLPRARKLLVDADLLFVLDLVLDACQHARRLRAVPGGAFAQPRIIQVGAFLEVDDDLLAVLLQHLQLLVVVENESLKHERRFGPGPVELGDVHAKLQLFDGYLFSHGGGVGPAAAVPAAETGDFPSCRGRLQAVPPEGDIRIQTRGCSAANAAAGSRKAPRFPASSARFRWASSG